MGNFYCPLPVFLNFYICQAPRVGFVPQKLGTNWLWNSGSFYVQVCDTLIEHKLKFSKAILKMFVQWIFIEFPNTSPDEARFLPFWEKIKGRMIFLQGCGDTSVEHFFAVLTLTLSIAKRPKKKVKVNTPVTPSPLSVPRLPHFP